MTKSSGITRRIDELGRIVVPKEMRSNLGIRDGEQLELFIEDNGIVIKKFSQVENIKKISENLCYLMSDICNVNVIITDREKVISASNNINNIILTKLGDKHKYLIDNREKYIGEKKEIMFDINGYFTIVPIVTTTDSSGLVIVISNEYDKVNLNYAKIIEKLIVQKLDIAS